MILCLSCKRLWNSGTVWCGNCHATLGKRLCSEGHASPISATCCTTCGSSKLSKGCPCLPLRVASAIFMLLLLAAIAPSISHLFALLAVSLELVFVKILLQILSWLIFSALAGAVLGEGARRFIWQSWSSAGRLLFQLLGAGVQLLVRGFTNLVRK